MAGRTFFVAEKPTPHISLADWNARRENLQNVAENEQLKSFELRHASYNLCHDIKIKTAWETYFNDNRLADRAVEINQWILKFEHLVRMLNLELDALMDEKTKTDNNMEPFNAMMNVTTGCLSNRDARLPSELTYDATDQELKNELCIAEVNKNKLIEHSKNLWEKIHKLQKLKHALMMDIEDKKEAIKIDLEQAALNEHSANITYKLDPSKVSKYAKEVKEWEERAQALEDDYEHEQRDAKAARERASAARAFAFNEVNAQRSATDLALRRRLRDTQRAIEELMWHKDQIEKSMAKMGKIISDIKANQQKVVRCLKLAETRLENRTYRPFTEMTKDESEDGLKKEARELNNSLNQLQNSLEQTTASYNDMEAQLIKFNIELDEKNSTIEIDTRSMEMREAIDS